MPSPRSFRRGGGEKSRKGRMVERSSSFHGQSSESIGEAMLRRPRTVPDLITGDGVLVRGVGVSASSSGSLPELTRPKLTKLLLNVTIQRSLGPVQVIMSPEYTVEDLVSSAVRQYVKEGRRPILPSADPSGYDLHYSQFSLESLSRKEKLVALGSRNFFLCPKKVNTETEDNLKSNASITTTRCSNQAEKVTKTGLSWLKFMDFLL